MQTVPPQDGHLLNDCYLHYMVEEEVHATIGFDIEGDREELLKMFHSGMFDKDSPQFALWDHKKQKVSKVKELVKSSRLVGLSIFGQTIWIRIYNIQNYETIPFL